MEAASMPCLQISHTKAKGRTALIACCVTSLSAVGHTVAPNHSPWPAPSTAALTACTCPYGCSCIPNLRSLPGLLHAGVRRSFVPISGLHQALKQPQHFSSSAGNICPHKNGRCSLLVFRTCMLANLSVFWQSRYHASWQKCARA